MEYPYARRISNLKASEIRELLKITERPEVINFGGGLPAPELFPVKESLAAAKAGLEEDGAAALQYSTTEGYAPLRRWIAGRMNAKRGTRFDLNNILITHGSQQALDFTGKVFLDEGDCVLCESPTYLAAIGAFRAYGCRFTEGPTDDNGMIPDELERIIRTTDRVKLIYVIPNFQNPTGRSWSMERREKLAELAAKYALVVIEDDPYGELRFEGEACASVKSADKVGCVLCLGTFSKIFCPGYRIGWVAGEESVISKYVLVKQGADLQCNTLAQREISKYLELNDIDAHIQVIRDVYKKRRDLMIRTMEETFPEQVVFTRPQGGLFAWAELPEHVNAREVLLKCLERNVAFVPAGRFSQTAVKKIPSG
jgi:2-aminoadipate transaminase